MPLKPQDDELDNTKSFRMLSPGVLISHYKIIERIGVGGMGEVYLAKDTELNRRVALKFLPQHLCQDDDCRARFKREAQAAAALKHANIITIHEVSEFQGRPFIVMEHIEGKSLRGKIKEKKLSINDAINLTMQICAGLKEAHEARIVHRDIKPSNILLDKNDQPIILDFGLATIKGTEKLTKTGSPLGTVGYMSPEQVKGEKADHRSDLFSVGVILYEMITGRLPFEAEHEAAIHYNIVNEVPEPLARYKSGMIGELQQIVDKALAKDPSLRYQHADGMLADLKRIKLSLDTGQSTVSAAWPLRRSMRTRCIVGALVVVAVAVAVIVTKPWVTDTVPDDRDQIRLVVLPFENLGGSEDDYFADGITDEITSRLAKIGGLSVISRTSAKKYRETEKTLKQIGAELDVGYVLEGTILLDKSGDTDRVRIIPQLIQVSDDSHIWAETYERLLTQIFEVQAEIATSIAEELDIALLEPEREALAKIPTESTEAYHAYLSAWGQETDSLTVQMFERAISLDPGFALAYVGLSRHHSWAYHLYIDHSEERLQLAKRAVDSALALQPDLPEAHLALGYYYYWGHREYDKALKELAIAAKGLPNDPAILMAEGYIWRRQGRFEDALADFTEAFQLDPGSGNAAYEVAGTNLLLRNYEEVLTYIDKAISLKPNVQFYYVVKTMALILMGDPQSARRLLSYLPSAERAWLIWTYLEIFERNYDAALQHLLIPQEELFRAGEAMRSVNVWRGSIYQLMGKDELAQIAFDSARVFLESLEGELAENVDIRMSLAMAYAGLGQKEKAIRIGQLALEKYPFSRDAIQGARSERDMALIYARTGEHDAAIDLLEHVMSVPHEFESIATLRNHPWWDSLRDHPRFQALIEKYETEYGN